MVIEELDPGGDSEHDLGSLNGVATARGETKRFSMRLQVSDKVGMCVLVLLNQNIDLLKECFGTGLGEHNVLKGCMGKTVSEVHMVFSS